MTTTDRHGTSERSVVESRCRNCGTFVTLQFARVFGDNDDDVYGCLDCMTATEIKRGDARRFEDFR